MHMTSARQAEQGIHQGLRCDVAGDYDADDIITPEAYARHAKQWKDLGATIIGGCCAVGPEHIKHLSSVIK